MKKIRIIIFVISCACTLLTAGPADQLPLVQKTDVTYLGAFALPDQTYGGSRFGYGGKGITHYLDPGTGTHTLFIEGHAWYPGLVAQVQVPPDSLLKKTSNWNSLAVAPLLQPFADVTDGKLGTLASSSSFVYGMLVYNGRLIVGASCYYDAANSQVNSHGVSGFDLSSTTDFKGFFPVSAVASPRSLGGYMTVIPAEWQTIFGGTALTGKGCISIISNNSSGPCATVFNPDDAGVKNPVPGKTVVYYPLSNPLKATGRNDLFNLATHMAGIAFPAGSRSVLFFGRQGTGEYCYGPGTSDSSLTGTSSGNGADPWCYDPADGSKGTHAYPYRHQVWAYDANDLVLVKNGSKQPWEMMPYAVWSMDDMNTSGSADMEGAGYDPETGRLYVTDNQGEEPHVHVYRIAVAGSGVLLPAKLRDPARGSFITCRAYDVQGRVVGIINNGEAVNKKIQRPGLYIIRGEYMDGSQVLIKTATE